MNSSDLDYVRPEYEGAARQMVAFVRNFGVPISEDLPPDILLFMRVMERVDAVLDAGDDQARAAITTDLLNLYRNSESGHPESGHLDGLRDSLRLLKERVDQVGNPVDFGNSLQAVLTHTEGLRFADDHQQFVKLVIQEGRATSELLIAFLGRDFNQRLKECVLLIGELANLTDKMMDCRTDSLRGEIAIQPNIAFYTTLVRESLPRAIQLIRFIKVEILISWLAKLPAYFMKYRARAQDL